MALIDRILPLCDLLLGAAYADQRIETTERAKVRELVRDLAGELSIEADLRITAFDPAHFDLRAAAAPFLLDSEQERRQLLVLVTAVIDADAEVDFAEDDYLRALAAALELPPSALAGLTVDVEPAELRTAFATARKGPPPPPRKK